MSDAKVSMWREDYYAIKRLKQEQEAELTRLRAENEELRKALEPFVFAFETADEPHPRSQWIDLAVRIHDCRRAAELLKTKP